MHSTACRAFLIAGLSFVALAAAPGRADKIVLVAGGGEGGDGTPATKAKLHAPFGVDFDQSGNMFIVELEGGHVHKVDADGVFSTIAGNGTKGDAGDGGSAAKAVFNAMHNLAVTPTGELLIADTLNHRVRRLDPKAGRIEAFAGTGKPGYAGDGGPARDAQFHGVYCVALSPDAKKLYLADLENRRVRAVDMATYKVELVAGNGEKGVPEDGADARRAPLVDPRAVAADAKGNVWILERGGHALRVVDRSGKIRTVAGTGKPGAFGDSGPARDATLRGPKHLCVDRDGSVIIADTDNHIIRRYLPEKGTISRVAGTGTMGASGLGGPPEQVELNIPHGVCVHRDGTLYIVDTGNDRVLKVVKE
jgi:sugar lactone lactonase YvrE